MSLRRNRTLLHITRDMAARLSDDDLLVVLTQFYGSCGTHEEFRVAILDEVWRRFSVSAPEGAEWPLEKGEFPLAGEDAKDELLYVICDNARFANDRAHRPGRILPAQYLGGARLRCVCGSDCNQRTMAR